ncbi:MAG: hypothetical protein IKX48_04220 [Victivallales bacterium]|nr:hypothetical protein [Victivallales bacterium]
MFYILLGAILYLFGSIGLLIIEFKEHIAWGLLGLFTQFGHGIFATFHFGKCKKYLLCIVIGILLVFLGFASEAKKYREEEQLTTNQQDAANDIQLPDIRKEYRPNSKLPVEKRPAAPVCDDWPETGYWLSTNSFKRHNKYCENYRRTRGVPCKKNDGTPCGKCGG